MTRSLRLTVGRWSPRVDGRTVTYRRGDVVEVDEEVAGWLLGTDAAVDVAAAPEPEPEPVVEVTPEPEPEEPEPSGPERPRNAARVELWQEYAAALGVNVSGMSKREIIAAVG